MKSTEQAQVPQVPENYETPEIVSVGSAIQLTSGQGGDSKDMDGYTIPVQPRDAIEESETE